ncbi:MAG: tetratricopeptide repeat protein [Bacteroidales bacterium]|nr:tetratricopeptide repeat protein [Bacteroidales bacterium]
MSKKKKKIGNENVEGIENALSKTEQYIEENQKSLSIIVAAIIIIVGGYFAYQKFYVNPLEIEAQSQMFVAEQYFEKDSFNLAIYGDGNYLGFLDIIDEYGVTKSANLANYYAGISYLYLGDYESAIDYLKGFDANDQIIAPIALGAIGDAYSELDEQNKAVSFYNKAALKSKNSLTTPIYVMKAAQIYEELNEFEKALELYYKIEKDYPKSQEGRYIEKYITRAKLLLQK